MNKLQAIKENGIVEHFSGEYFNRYKGLEFRLELKILDELEYIVGYSKEYPDSPVSYPNCTYYLISLDQAEKHQAERDIKQNDAEAEGLSRQSWKFPHDYTILNDPDAIVSKEKFEAAKEQATNAPTCPTCHRVIQK
jgi:hypothetical protein